MAEALKTGDPTVKKPKMMPRGQPFTPETSRAVQAKATAAKHLRKEMRKKMLEAVISVGIDKHLAKALATHDMDALRCVELASKLTGLDFLASEDAVQKIDAKVDAKTSGKLEVVVTGLDE